MKEGRGAVYACMKEGRGAVYAYMKEGRGAVHAYMKEGTISPLVIVIIYFGLGMGGVTSGF